MSYSSQSNTVKYMDKDGTHIVNSFANGTNFVISIACRENEFGVSITLLLNVPLLFYFCIAIWF